MIPVGTWETKAQSVYWQTLAKQLVSGEEGICTYAEKRESILVARKEMYAKHLEIRKKGEIKQSYVYM